MGQVLYRKYRSKSLEELVGQEHITQALSRAIQQGNISHAYLFTGPRGVGKTSVARILAHAINDLPYTDDSSHLDIIEIDAASNRRIDEIRDLRDRVHIAPTSAKYKVYIIDEVHMLTREAFNALLKTLEEPPAHVVFILATTESHKLPETIISRTQRFTFRPVEADKVVGHLRNLAESEGMAIDDDALSLLAQHGEGSFRDSISLLDQARATSSHITLQDVQTLLGLAPEELIANLVHAIETGDTKDTVNILQQAREQGLEAAMIARQLGRHLRQDLLEQDSSFAPSSALKLLERLLAVSASNDPTALLEIILLDASFTQQTNDQQSRKPTTPITPIPPTESKKASRKSTAEPKAPPTITPDEPIKPAIKAPLGITSLDETMWQQALTELKKSHNTLYGIARMAHPEFDNNELVLHCKFAFHQKRLSEAKNKKIITDILYTLCGQAIAISCVQTTQVESPTASKAQAASDDSPAASSPNEPLAAISNIFGGGELLES